MLMGGLAGVCAVCLCGAVARADREYAEHHPRHGWNVAIPPGWTEAEASFVESANAMVRERMPTANVRYTGGFVREGAAAGAYPYILLQFTPMLMEGLTYEKFAQDIGAMDMKHVASQIKGSMADVLAAVTVNTPVMDREHNRLILRSVLGGVGGVGGEEVSGFSVSYLAQDGLVQLHAYAKKDSGEDPAVLLQPFLDSFRFDPGCAFEPASNWFSWSGAGRG